MIRWKVLINVNSLSRLLPQVYSQSERILREPVINKVDEKGGRK